MAVTLNALGSGLISGVNAGSQISQNNRESEKWDMYKARVNETDATTAFATTLQDQFGGDMNSMLDSPSGQQIAFNYIQQNKDVKDALSSNRGWEPSGLVRGDDGNYFVMLRNDSGEHRPLTVDRRTGTQPLRLSKDDLYTMMGASAAKLGVFNNPQMMKFIEQTMPSADFEMVKSQAGVDTSVADAKIPRAPSLESTSKVARSNATAANKPEPISVSVPTPASEVTDGKDPQVATRYNKSLSDLVESGMSVSDLPAGVRQDIKKESESNRVNLDELSPEERQRMLGDEAPQTLGEPVSRDTTNADTTVPSRADVNDRKAVYNQRVAELQKERADSGNNWTDDEIYQAATAGVSPDDLRMEARAAQGQQPTFDAGSVPPFMQQPQLGNLQNRAANIDSSPARVAPQGNTSFLDTAMQWLGATGQAYNAAMDTTQPNESDRSFGERLGGGIRRAADIAGGYVQGPANVVRGVADNVMDFGSDVVSGFTGNSNQQPQQQPAQNKQATPDVVKESVDRRAVRAADAADPQKRDNIEAEIGGRIRAETPQTRVEEDMKAYQQISRQTKSPNARQKYAAMRLYMSGAVPAQAYQNYLEHGRWEGNDLKDALSIINARTNQVKAQAAANKNSQAKDTEGRAVREEKRKLYDNNIETASGIVAADLASSSNELMRALTEEGSGINAREFAAAALDTVFSNPDNVYLVSGGRTTDKTDLKDFEVQKATAMVLDKLNKWTQGKEAGWFSREKPSMRSLLNEINLRDLSQQGQ